MLGLVLAKTAGQKMKQKIVIHRAKLAHWCKCHPIGVGITILVFCFAMEHISDHFIWGAFVEVFRAAGVVPIWDSISVFFNLYSESKGE